ncbi:MAG: hypothetical protein GEV08_00895 [Acidimicrobiia bacterium]|nr:hypothetical protein [Acidimicrobiia bacterium]
MADGDTHHITHLITQLWVNGTPVRTDGARLALGAHGLTWQVDAELASHSPFRREFGLSIALEDGRTAHGRARLTAAEGDHVVFEGIDTLTGSAVVGDPP